MEVEISEGAKEALAAAWRAFLMPKKSWSLQMSLQLKDEDEGTGKGKNRGQFQKLMQLGLHPQTRYNKPVCPYFNISSGCMHGEACQMLHECALCAGSTHSWCRAHPNQAAV